MRKIIALFASLVVAMSIASIAFASDAGSDAADAGGAEIAAIYARPDVTSDVQANADSSVSKEGVYTVLICYSDGTFSEFTEADGDMELRVAGTYEMPQDGNFTDPDSGEPVDITFLRSQTYQAGKPAGFNRTHEFYPDTLGYELLYAFDESNPVTVEAVFCGIDKQRFVDENESESMLDTCWIYYDNMTFDQYACLDNDVKLFSTGTYEFSEGGDFSYDAGEEDYGDITLNRNQKYTAADGLQPYESSHTYDLNSLGFVEVAVGAF